MPLWETHKRVERERKEETQESLERDRTETRVRLERDGAVADGLRYTNKIERD